LPTIIQRLPFIFTVVHREVPLDRSLHFSRSVESPVLMLVTSRYPFFDDWTIMSDTPSPSRSHSLPSTLGGAPGGAPSAAKRTFSESDDLGPVFPAASNAVTLTVMISFGAAVTIAQLRPYTVL